MKGLKMRKLVFQKVGLYVFLWAAVFLPFSADASTKVRASSIQGDDTSVNPENVLDSNMLTRWSSNFTDQEWLVFLRKINKSTPKDKEIHIICDNYVYIILI